MTILSNKLQSIDLNTLLVSDYMRRYLTRMMPVADYYLGIYEHGLQKLMSLLGKPASEITMVDYGGGHGFLTLLALEMGIGHVVYLDINPESAQAFQTIADKLSVDADRFSVIIGDSTTLKNYCLTNSITPDMLMGMDVIEHVYCIDDTFGDLVAINPKMPMLFTTASTPYNKRIVKRLHREMRKDEMGDPSRSDKNSRRGFLNVRKDFIKEQFPHLTTEQIDYWATHTRGLVFDDIRRAVEQGYPNLLRDPFNTCDPATGSWTERILPIKDYQQILNPYQYRLEMDLGWYNPANRGLKGMIQKHYNKALLKGRRKSKAPFLFLYFVR